MDFSNDFLYMCFFQPKSNAVSTLFCFTSLTLLGTFTELVAVFVNINVPIK